MARYPVNLIGVSRLDPSALRWPYGIRDCRVGAATTCDVFLKARGTRLGGHAAMLMDTQLKIFAYNYGGTVLVSFNCLHEAHLNDYMLPSQALLAPPQQCKSVLCERCDEN